MSGFFTGMSVHLRFWSKVKPAPFTECWEWEAGLGSTGYGQFYYKGRPWKAHRVAYELMVCEIPDGLQLDHLCRNTICVNPWHLEPVTNAVNTARGNLSLVMGDFQRAKTHCPSGHEYTPANTYHHPDGYRSCKECSRIRCLRNYYLKKAAGS